MYGGDVWTDSFLARRYIITPADSLFIFTQANMRVCDILLMRLSLYIMMEQGSAQMFRRTWPWGKRRDNKCWTPCMYLGLMVYMHVGFLHLCVIICWFLWDMLHVWLLTVYKQHAYNSIISQYGLCWVITILLSLYIYDNMLNGRF